MKYSVEITINKPMVEVIRTFGNPAEMQNWMQGLLSFEHEDQEYGNPGSKTNLVFKSGKKKMKIVETIISNDLPKDFTASYNTKNVFNKIRNTFEEKGPNETRYISHQEFHFSGMMKLFSLFMAGAFKKQSFQYLKDFKDYVESK